MAWQDEQAGTLLRGVHVQGGVQLFGLLLHVRAELRQTRFHGVDPQTGTCRSRLQRGDECAANLLIRRLRERLQNTVDFHWADSLQRPTQCYELFGGQLGVRKHIDGSAAGSDRLLRRQVRTQKIELGGFYFCKAPGHGSQGV